MVNLSKDKDAKLYGLNKYDMPASYSMKSWCKPTFLFMGDDLSPLSDSEKQMILKEVVANLPKIRQMIKISQTELGNKVGLSRQSILRQKEDVFNCRGVYFLQLCL